MAAASTAETESSVPHEPAPGERIDGGQTDPGVTRAPASAEQQQVLADGEVPSLRTERSQTFVDRDGGGYRSKVSAEPLHVPDPAGGWLPVDLSLVDAGQGRLRGRATPVEVVLPADLTAPVRVARGEDTVELTLRGAVSGAAARERRTVRADRASYRAAVPGADVAVQVTKSGVKQTATLSGPSSPRQFVYDLRLSPRLRPVPTESGAIELRRADGQVAGVVTSPFMQDARGAKSTAVKLTVSAGAAGGWVLTEQADDAWLDAPDRAWPVVVDPDIVLQDPAKISACAIENDSGTVHYCGGGEMRVGMTALGPWRGLVKFDDVNAAVRTDANVLSGELYLTQRSVAFADRNQDVELRRMTAPWTMSANWNTSDGATPWPAGGAVAATVERTQQLTPTNEVKAFTVTRLVQDWVSGEHANYGLMLRSASETGDQMRHFGDSVCAGCSPELWIHWEQRVGPRSESQFLDVELDDHQAAQINYANGNLYLESRDLALSGPGLDLVVTRGHNSRRWWYGSAGKAWDMWPLDSYARYQPPHLAPDESIDYAGPGRVRYLFHRAPDGSFTSPPGLGADAMAHGDGTVTIVFRKSGEKHRFGTDGALTSISDRNGNTQTFTPTTWTDTAGRTVTRSVVNGLTKSLTDPLGRVVTYHHDSRDHLTGVTHVDGRTTTYEYDNAGYVIALKTGSGRTTRFYYDSIRRVTALTRVTDYANQTGPTTRFAYTDPTTPGGTGTTVVTDPRGNNTTYTWDVRNRILSVKDALNRTRSATYGPDNNQLTSTDAMTPGNTTTTAYDSDHRPTGTTSPDGAASTLRYAEPAGTVTSRTGHWLPSGGIDANGSDTSITYDGPGNVAGTSTAAPTGAVSVSYTRNPPAPAAPVCGGKPGQVCTATDGRGKVTSYSYTSNGELQRIDNPAPLGDVTFTYDAASRVTSRTDGKGQVTRYTYDELDRVTQLRLGGVTTCNNNNIKAGTCLTYAYDEEGRLRFQTDQTGTTEYGYDELGRINHKKLPGQNSQFIGWDAASNLDHITDPSGTTRYQYDSANQLRGLSEPGALCPTDLTQSGPLCTRFEYNNNGARIRTIYPTTPTPTVMDMAPDNSGRVGRIKLTTGSTAHSDLSYTYTDGSTDTTLTRSRIDNLAAATAGKTTTYSYDALNRLTKAVETTSSAVTTASWTYCYDNAGNRTLDSTSPTASCATTPANAVYNDANQLISRNGNSTGFGYDANGNETRAVGATTRTNGTWNNKDQLTSITAGGTAIPFTYTGTSQDERLSRGSGSGETTFVSSPNGLATETTSGVTTSFVRDPAGTLIAMKVGTSRYYYGFDGLGSVVALVDSSGNKVNSYSYDPYGKNRSKTEGVANPYEYTGGYLDDATGLYKLGIRYYDPTLGRFTQIDPSGQDPHYTYARNSPCNYKDPSGASSVSDYLESCITDAIGGAFVGFFTGGLAGAALGAAEGCVEGLIVEAVEDRYGENSDAALAVQAVFSLKAVREILSDPRAVIRNGEELYGLILRTI